MSKKEMLYIPSAEVEIGITQETADRLFKNFFPQNADLNPYIFYSEVPARKVKVGAFHISRYEITNEEFHEFVKEGGYERKEFWKELISTSDLNTDLGGWDRIALLVDLTGKPGPAFWRNGFYSLDKAAHPVEGVSWFEAAAYCRWKKMRLPSESEWEYAARGMDSRIFPWGNDFGVIDNWGLYQAAESTPVGFIVEDRSPFGVMDMARNAAEWVDDTWTSYPNSPIQDSKRNREAFGILRGGHYTSVGWQMRTTARVRTPRLNRTSGTGFRVASN